MAINLVHFWPWVFMRDIARRASRIRTEADLERWVEESKGWMTHLVEKEARRNGMIEQDRAAMSDRLVEAFNAVYLIHCERVYGRASA